MSTPVHAAPPIDAASKSPAGKDRSAVPVADVTLPTVRLPVDARGVALAILATLALVVALEWR